MACCNGGYHEFNLDWFLKRFKEIEEEWDGTKKWLQDWINSFNIEQEVKNVMQEWLDDGTIENLINQEIFGELNEKVNTNTQNISSLETRMSEAETDIAGNATAIRSVDNRVDELEARKPINMLGKRFVLLADSYGEFGCMEQFISVMLGTAVESKWTGGAGFTKSGEQSFTEMLDSLNPHDDIDYVVVFGFYNDSFDVNNIGSNVITFRNVMNRKYPGAELILVNQGWSGNVEYQGQFQYMLQSLNNISGNNLYTLINTWQVLHIYSNMQSDLIHPTERAGVIQGAIAAKILRGSNPIYNFPIQQVTPSYINGWQAYGSTAAPYQEMNESECLLHFVNDVNHYGIDAGTNIKCNGSNYVEIFEFPLNKGCIIGSGDMLLNIPCILGLANGTYRAASCTLEVYNRKLRVRPYLLNSAGNDFETIQLNSIQWTPCTIRSNILHI